MYPVNDEERIGLCHKECLDPVECTRWGREGCVQGKTEHRGSRMPELIREAASDPLFADAVFNEFQPDEKAVREKE